MQGILSRLCSVPNFCLTARVRYAYTGACTCTDTTCIIDHPSQNDRFVAVPERSSCLGLKGDDIRGYLARVCFACGRARIICASNLLDPGAFPHGRVVFSS